MRPNPMRQRFEEGAVALGGWLSMPSSISAEVMAGTGLDYACIDMQHGLVGYPDIIPMLQAIRTGTATPVLRVPENQNGYIGKALDAGAMGVIVPMVNSRAECEAAMRAARYAPQGGRSYGPSRVAAVEGPDYWERANSDVALIPMIETVEALSNIDEILSVSGVEAIYVGPADLSISLGNAPGSNEENFLDVLDQIVAACVRHDVVPGIHATATTARDRMDRGFRMVTITSDLVALRAKLQADVDMVRAGLTGTDSDLY